MAKVLEGKVLVSVEEKTETVVTEFGLTVPVEAMDTSGVETAVVEHVGPKVLGVEAGESVYIYKGAGKEITIEDKKYRVVSSSEIIVVL